MISINALSSECSQRFYLFDFEAWENHKNDFPGADRFFSAKKDEIFVYANAQNVDFLIGFGENEELKSTDFLEIAQKFSTAYRKKFYSIQTSIDFYNLFNDNYINNFIEGLFLGTYTYPFDKEHPFWKSGFGIQIKDIDSAFAKQISERTEAVCYGQFAAMEWMNKPANFKTAKLLSFFLGEESHKLKLKYRSLNRSECKQEGMGAYLAVNSASAQEAAFTILEYDSGIPNAKKIGLVGKCVLFDTGGISIKGSRDMHHMKSDMGGAAAVIGALLSAAKLKLPIDIVAVLPITDNVISNQACLPGDVVIACNGKSIEIINTDAEGRLTLADGLAYITKHYKTDVLIDLATLTGSVVRMFGHNCAGYFSNQTELKEKLEQSAKRSGQRIWNLPLWDDWLEEIRSDVADLKNISLKPYSDCIIAAKFLEQFIGDHPNWAHLDIAGVAFSKVNYANEPAATGYGVRLLLDLIENLK
ncbi:MAG: leucyl aminopeptidase family protein [Flavobacteriia bacterium]|nr:leucyl aminopeptidase family protein [Flavobacteriia bacterium]